MRLREQWEDLLGFVGACKDGGVSKMIMHARSCVLNGLTPAQNRNIPPLKYEWVHRLCAHFPDMEFVLNGAVLFYCMRR